MGMVKKSCFLICILLIACAGTDPIGGGTGGGGNSPIDITGPGGGAAPGLEEETVILEVDPNPKINQKEKDESVPTGDDSLSTGSGEAFYLQYLQGVLSSPQNQDNQEVPPPPVGRPTVD